MGDIQIYSSAYAINSAQHEDPLLHTKTTVGENCTENEGEFTVNNFKEQGKTESSSAECRHDLMQC